MPKPLKHGLSKDEVEQRRKYVSLSGSRFCPEDDVQVSTLPERIERILGILNTSDKSTDMIFFVMYDIESSKVRRYLFKYLVSMGCHNVQRSVFLARLSPEKYQRIRSDLAEVQARYKNNDSIMIVPVSVDYMKSMSIIGQQVDMDVIMKNKNTIFF